MGGGRRFQNGHRHARALTGARAHAAVAALFAPMFDAPGLGADTPGVEFLAPVVARSLAALGREGEGRLLLERVAALFPRDNSGRDLNLLAALMTTDANALRWAAVAPRATEFLDRARAAGPSVNRSAVLQVLATRGCAHWNTGRRAEAEADMAPVLLAQAVQPGAAWRVLACRGDDAGQRAFLLARLGDEQTRDWALAMLQPSGAPPSNPLERIERGAAERAGRSPEVATAAAKVGRVLPHAIGDTLPAGFDPFAARPVRRRAPGDI